MKKPDEEKLAREKYETSEAKESYRRPPKRHSNRDSASGQFHPNVGIADIREQYAKKGKGK